MFLNKLNQVHRQLTQLFCQGPLHLLHSKWEDGVFYLDLEHRLKIQERFIQFHCITRVQLKENTDANSPIVWCLSEVISKRIWLSENNISGFINVWTNSTTVGKTCHTAVQVTSQFYCRLSSCESIDRTLSWVIWSQSCRRPALSLREEQLVTSLGVEINGGSPPGDGWWEYITTNKCLPRCRRRQSLTCWLLSTQGEQRGAELSIQIPSSLLRGLPESKRNERLQRASTWGWQKQRTGRVYASLDAVFHSTCYHIFHLLNIKSRLVDPAILHSDVQQLLPSNVCTDP